MFTVDTRITKARGYTYRGDTHTAGIQISRGYTYQGLHRDEASFSSRPLLGNPLAGKRSKVCGCLLCEYVISLERFGTKWKLSYAAIVLLAVLLKLSSSLQTLLDLRQKE